MQVWARIVNVKSITTINASRKETIELTSHILKTLLDRASNLEDACRVATFRDLQFEEIPIMAGDNYEDDDGDDSG